MLTISDEEFEFLKSLLGEFYEKNGVTDDVMKLSELVDKLILKKQQVINIM